MYHERVKSCLLALFLFGFYTPTEATKIENSSGYAEIFRSARYRIDILTPGFFSIRLSKLLKSLKEQGILIRILMDSTFLTDPENSILELHDALPLRILEDVRRIPHNLILIDQSLLYLGGEFFSDHEAQDFKPVVIQDPIQLKKTAEFFQSIWAESSLITTRALVRELEFSLETEVSASVETVTGTRGTGSRGRMVDSGFIASTRSKVYHRASSTAAQRIMPENRVYFQTEEDARKTNRKRAKNF